MHRNVHCVVYLRANTVKTFTLKENLSNDADGFIKSLKETIQEINHALGEAPNADGATYLEAISKAGREAVSQQGKKKVKVIVRGSGLSDGGVLNFADDDLLHKELDEVVSRLEEAGEIVDDLAPLDFYPFNQIEYVHLNILEEAVPLRDKLKRVRNDCVPQPPHVLYEIMEERRYASAYAGEKRHRRVDDIREV